MNYKFRKKRLFGKRLKVPKDILNKVYNCTLSFSEFVDYELEDKIPITCLNRQDRQIVEKFGMEKAKTLDWELLSKGLYYNINFLELLMGIDTSVEDLNTSLYELIKDKIKPSDYTLRMKQVYQDRLFEISQDDNGKISLVDLVCNRDLYKDKDLSYCLQSDRHNELNITNS